MKNKTPAYLFYASDFSSSTTGLSLAATGALVKLHAWLWAQAKDQCSIADDDQMIARILGVSVDEWKVIRAELQHSEHPQFEEREGRLVASHLREQAEKQRIYREKQRKNSLKGVEARATKRASSGQPMVDPPVNPSVDPAVSERSASAKPCTSHRDVLNGHRAGFERFYSVFPKKRGKGRAERVWAKLRPDDALVNAMLSKIEQAKRTPEWMKEGGQFIPHPATWLKSKGWEDDYCAVSTTNRIPL